MSLVAQWQAIAARLPQGWRELRLRLRLDRKEDVARASALLGAMSPGRSGDTINLLVDRHGAQSVGMLERLLARLDDHGILATLEEAAVEEAAEADAPEAAEADTAVMRAVSLA